MSRSGMHMALYEHPPMTPIRRATILDGLIDFRKEHLIDQGEFAHYLLMLGLEPAARVKLLRAARMADEPAGQTEPEFYAALMRAEGLVPATKPEPIDPVCGSGMYFTPEHILALVQSDSESEVCRDCQNVDGNHDESCMTGDR